jgi:hypothetical protein
LSSQRISSKAPRGLRELLIGVAWFGLRVSWEERADLSIRVLDVAEQQAGIGRGDFDARAWCVSICPDSRVFACLLPSEEV